MKKILFSVLLISLFLGTTALSGLAASEHEEHHPGGTATPAVTSTGGMMGQMGMDMGQKPCMSASASGGMMPMMDHGMGGMMDHQMGAMMGAGMGKMMDHRMEHPFYLDRVDELGLSAEQVKELKALQVDCRKENIRTAAEIKIARLDLANLLAGDSWKLKDAEALIRKVQQLEGDIQKAISKFATCRRSAMPARC